MNKNLTFNVAEATELGTHCALHHSYSPQEQKYIFRLDVYNQKQIRMAISQNAHHGQLDLNGFEHLENNLRFEVPYRALEATKSHYNNLETALIDIGKKPVYIPYTAAESDNPGTNHLCYKRFDYLYHFVDYTKKGQEKRAILEMPIPVAQYYFALDLGYFKVSPQLYESFHHQSSRCLYLLTESRLKKGYTKFPPPEILALLTSHTQYRGTGNLEYSQLSTAEEEIRNAYKLNRLDYIVTHTIEMTRNNVVGKYGSLIIFEIRFRNEDQNMLSGEDKTKLAIQKLNLRNVLTSSYWNVSHKVAEELSDRLTLSDLDAVRQCFLAAYAEKAKHEIKNPAGYIVSSLDKILKKNQPVGFSKP